MTAQTPAAKSTKKGRFASCTHAIVFVLGFSVVFVMLGAAVTAIGQLLYEMRNWITFIGGIIVVTFGLETAGWLCIPFLQYEKRYHGSTGRDPGYLSSFLMGVFFSAGWTPCIGPTLGAILALGLNENTVGQGTVLLAGYSLGLGMPFLLTGLAMDRATTLFMNMRRYMPVVKIVTASLLIALGVMLIADSLPAVSSHVGDWFDADWTFACPAWFPSMQGLSRWAMSQGVFLDVTISSTVIKPTFFVSFLAGLVSFFSPCVLPLVPAYIGYLGSRAVYQADQAGSS